MRSETVAGVELDNNTASTKQSERWVEWRQNLCKSGTVAGVELNNNTAASAKQSERWIKWRQNLRKWDEKTNPSNFRKTIAKMRSISRSVCGWSGASTTTQEYETGEKTVLKCLFERARHWVDELALTLGCVWYQKTLGLPIVGDSKTIHVSKSRPF